MFWITFDPEWFMACMGIVISLLFSYFPWLNTWWVIQDETFKKLVMLGLGVITLCVIAIFSCVGILNDPTCDKYGVVAMLKAFFFWVMANQAAYKLSPHTMKYRSMKAEAKAARLYQAGIGVR